MLQFEQAWFSFGPEARVWDLARSGRNFGKCSLTADLGGGPPGGLKKACLLGPNLSGDIIFVSCDLSGRKCWFFRVFVACVSSTSCGSSSRIIYAQASAIASLAHLQRSPAFLQHRPRGAKEAAWPGTPAGSPMGKATTSATRPAPACSVLSRTRRPRRRRRRRRW